MNKHAIKWLCAYLTYCLTYVLIVVIAATLNIALAIAVSGAGLLHWFVLVLPATPRSKLLSWQTLISMAWAAGVYFGVDAGTDFLREGLTSDKIAWWWHAGTGGSVLIGSLGANIVAKIIDKNFSLSSH